MNRKAILWTVILVLGFVCLGAAAFFWQDTDQFLSKAMTARGEVVELIGGKDSGRVRSDHKSSYKPVVVFDAKDGREIRFTSNVSSNPPMYQKGERVEVLYLEEDPENAMIKGFFSIWLLTIIFSLMGAIMIVIGALGIFFQIFRAKPDSLAA